MVGFEKILILGLFVKFIIFMLVVIELFFIVFGLWIVLIFKFG